MEWRFATARDREAVVALIVDAAIGASIRLTPPELAASPEPFRWADGSSRFRPRQSVVFSSAALLAAEDQLGRASRRERVSQSVYLSVGRRCFKKKIEQT